jgi:hypothetical protein
MQNQRKARGAECERGRIQIEPPSTH